MQVLIVIVLNEYCHSFILSFLPSFLSSPNEIQWRLWTEGRFINHNESRPRVSYELWLNRPWKTGWFHAVLLISGIESKMIEALKLTIESRVRKIHLEVQSESLLKSYVATLSDNHQRRFIEWRWKCSIYRILRLGITIAQGNIRFDWSGPFQASPSRHLFLLRACFRRQACLRPMMKIS